MLYQFGGASPQVASSAYVAPSAALIGNVVLSENTTVWFGAILRGDIEPINIGSNSNVQDAVVMHTDQGHPLMVGTCVSIGHKAVLHGCTVNEGSLIGIQAVILSGAVIGKGCLVGSGAVVTERKVFPDYSLILGSPAKAVRELTESEIAKLLKISHGYVERGVAYKATLKTVPGPG